MKLHIGCGWRDFGKDWVHIDAGNYPHVEQDVRDICNLPYDNDSAELIYASHVIEYFDRNDVVNLLTEWVRVLKSGGTLRIAVPDFEVLSQLYTDEKITLQQVLGPLYGKMPLGKETIYHKTTYDFDSLREVLESLGMKNIKTYNWRKTCHAKFDDHSQAYIPHMNKENGVLVSLNVEATK